MNPSSVPRAAGERSIEAPRVHGYSQSDLEAAGWPSPLVKASFDDEFSYMIGLRNGLIIGFTGAKPHDPRLEWVRLMDARIVAPTVALASVALGETGMRGGMLHD
ncbi:MAG: hypothetical protein NZ518_06250, partial [Dehalococcoidia bacterium]|nr:hypothetical protein [Dehalococcoidia bacterium]